MVAEELSTAFHAPSRSELNNIWSEALHGDDDMDDDHHMGSLPDHSTTSSGSPATVVSPSSSSSSNSSSPTHPPQQQHVGHAPVPMNPATGHYFYPTGHAHLQMNELSAFLASQSAGLQPPTPNLTALAVQNIPGSTTTAQPSQALAPSFIDDLLSSTDDMDFRSSRGATTANYVEQHPQMHALPPSIQQQLTQSAFFLQRQQAATPQMLTDSSYLGLESTDGNASTEDSDQHTAGVSNSGAIASRLLQLENNYERKKKRAKINRKDLNARFQELMEILNLKEDRKLNRAKILEKTIEYIEKLEDELHAAKSQLDPKKATTVSPPNQPAPSPQMLLHNPSPSHAIGSGGPLMTFDPTNPHAWSATGHPAMPMTPMMWLPCSMMAPSGATLRNQRTRAEKRSTVRGGKPKQVAPGPSSTFMQTSVPASVTVEGARRNLKRSRESSTAEASTPVNSTTAVVSTTVIQASKSEAASERLQSVFAWSAQEIPAVLAFCDAWMLARLMQTSKELGGAARQNKLWIELSRRRWGICGAQLQLSNALEQWKRWDREIYMPACGSTISGSIRFASGRVKDIHIWGLLARRSNGRTTRTVLQSGKATVMQVVEIYLVVQNMSQARVHLTDQISVSPIGNASAAASSSAFEPFPSGSSAHLTPHVLSFNGEVCATKDIKSVVLHHGDLCVLDIFLQCPGLDLEQEFLQRAAWLSVECKSELSQRTGAAEAVTVRAQCLDEAQKKQLISTSYSSLDVEP